MQRALAIALVVACVVGAATSAVARAGHGGHAGRVHGPIILSGPEPTPHFRAGSRPRFRACAGTHDQRAGIATRVPRSDRDWAVGSALMPALPPSPAAAPAARGSTVMTSGEHAEGDRDPPDQIVVALDVVEPAGAPAAEEAAELVAEEHDAPQHRHVRRPNM